MTVSLGDILVKVDLRATAETINTRHHVMLVLGENDKGHPIVIHMMAAPHWKLIKEELTRGKELTLIHCAFPEKTQKAIAQAAEDSLNCDNFIINTQIIQEHNEEVSHFRPDCSLDAQKKLENLHQAFHLDEKNIHFIPAPQQKTLMSCHQWVISIIHYACRQTQVPIPMALQIPPHLAWADRLYYSSKQDSSISDTTVTFEFPYEKPDPLLPVSLIPECGIRQRTNSLFSFFAQTKKPTLQHAGSLSCSLP